MKILNGSLYTMAVFSLLAIWMVAPSKSYAQINLILTDCDAAGLGSTANHWKNTCSMLIDEQETPTAADGLKMFFIHTATPFIGGIPQGFQSGSGWFTGSLTPTNSPYTSGWYLHSGFVIGGGTAIKYTDIPTNILPILLCVP